MDAAAYESVPGMFFFFFFSVSLSFGLSAPSFPFPLSGQEVARGYSILSDLIIFTVEEERDK